MMGNKIKLAHHSQCTGCSACFSVCAKQAITMKTDSAGFKFPYINDSLCVECHKCEKVCPILNRKEEQTGISSYILAQSRCDNYLSQCASGGIFATIANYFVEKGGIVVGAAYDNELKVHHIAIKDSDGINPLYGSKYVQSELGNSFADVKQALNENKLVCFSGTPCQVAGLKSFLGKQYDNLITVDFLCHSVASPKAFELYKKYLIQNYGPLKSIKFKSKKYGYSFPTTEISYLKNGNIKTANFTSQNDGYLYAFLHGHISRESCEHCFYRKNHKSDITIADYYAPLPFGTDLNEEKGISRVILWNNENNFFKEIKERLLFYEMGSKNPFMKNDLVDHHSERINFDLLKSQDEDVFYRHHFKIPLKTRIMGFGRIVMHKLHLQKTIKYLIKR